MHAQILVERLYTVLYQERERGFALKGETHPYWEITYVDKGSMICAVDGVDYRLGQGDLLFFTGGRYHSQKANGEEIASFITVIFDLNFFPQNKLEGKVIHADNAIHQILKNMMNEYHSKSIHNEEVIMSLLTQLIVYSLRNLQKNSAVRSISSALTIKAKSKLVSDALRTIDEKIGSPVTIGFLASKLCVSSSMLTKAFKNETGYTISEYVRNHRMKMAKDLIRIGDYSITQVSDMLGFSSICYFSGAFKKAYAITPSAFSRAVNQE